MKHFNVTGLCTPDTDYMVDISDKIKQIRNMVDMAEYFTINRARQYGKTTTLQALKKNLNPDYIVSRISFEGIGGTIFSDEAKFCLGFDELFGKSLRFSSATPEDILLWTGYPKDADNFLRLSEKITDFCICRKVVLLIDEVDQASDNQVFLHFLGMLREKYLARKANEDFTFFSVILAGVYDIKNMKLRMIEQGYHTALQGETKYNSPWNIAANFDIDMSFSALEIESMLSDYETDHRTGMDVPLTASRLWDYTNGYPFLVSRICQEIDETKLAWDNTGIQMAVKKILLEKSTLFDDISHHLENNAELRTFMYELLILGQEKHFERSNGTVDLAATFGFIRNDNGKSIIDNRLFEIKITNYFISRNQEDKKQLKITGVLSEDVIQDGHFCMEYVLETFSRHYRELYENIKNRKFLEENGRILFLTYLRPLINGKGFYHIESCTNTERRMDLVVDYGTEQYVLKLTFDFRSQKKPRMEWVTYQGKQIFDIII